MTAPPRYPSASEAGLVLRLAASALDVHGWSPDRGDEAALEDDAGRLTLLGALAVTTGLPVTPWPLLAAEPLQPLWDALALAQAAHLGLEALPRRGLELVERVLVWERGPDACLEDVREVLRLAAVLAESATAHVTCPECDGEEARTLTCGVCEGSGALALHPARWTRTHLRLVGAR